MAVVSLRRAHSPDYCGDAALVLGLLLFLVGVGLLHVLAQLLHQRHAGRVEAATALRLPQRRTLYIVVIDAEHVDGGAGVHAAGRADLNAAVAAGHGRDDDAAAVSSRDSRRADDQDDVGLVGGVDVGVAVPDADGLAHARYGGTVFRRHVGAGLVAAR